MAIDAVPDDERHPRCRVMIVDDHSMVRAGLRTMLSIDRAIDVVAEATGYHDALARLATHRIDVAIVDIHLKDGSGFVLIGRLKAQQPLAKVLIVSAQDEQTCGGWAIQFGADGYVDKHAEPGQLRQAVLEVWRGRLMFSDTVMREYIRGGRGEPRSPIKRLTAREFDVFLHLGLGHSTQEIADILGTSPRTTETHCRNIRATLRVPHHSSLVRLATMLFANGGDIGAEVRSDRALLAAFEGRTLTDAQWSHRAHLRVAFLYLSHRPFDEALNCIRDGIRALNQTHGRANAYHETVTVAWARILHERIGRQPIWYHSAFFLEAWPELLGPPAGAELQKHYTPDRLATPKARATFVEPDRQPLPVVEEAEQAVRAPARIATQPRC